MTYIYNHDPLLPIDCTSKLMAFKVRIQKLLLFLCVLREKLRDWRRQHQSCCDLIEQTSSSCMWQILHSASPATSLTSPSFLLPAPFLTLFTSNPQSIQHSNTTYCVCLFTVQFHLPYQSDLQSQFHTVSQVPFFNLIFFYIHLFILIPLLYKVQEFCSKHSLKFSSSHLAS